MKVPPSSRRAIRSNSANGSNLSNICFTSSSFEVCVSRASNEPFEHPIGYIRKSDTSRLRSLQRSGLGQGFQQPIDFGFRGGVDEADANRSPGLEQTQPSHRLDGVVVPVPQDRKSVV